MKLTELHTDRLILRAITPEVYHYIFRLDDAEVMAFFGCSTSDELELERARLNKGLNTFNKTFLYFQLIEKTTNKIIGWCGFHTWYTDHDRAELGYGLNQDRFKQKGFMSEAIPPILEYGFTEMKLHRIEAFTSPTNTPSIKLLNTNHFQPEGLMKEHYLKDGVYEDSAIYALLKSAIHH